MHSAFPKRPCTAMGLISTLFLAASVATFSVYFRRLSDEAPAQTS